MKVPAAEEQRPILPLPPTVGKEVGMLGAVCLLGLGLGQLHMGTAASASGHRICPRD